MRKIVSSLLIVAVLTSCQNELDNYVEDNISVNYGEFNATEDKGDYGFSIEVVDPEWNVIYVEL
jgi:hypothetical protein